MSIVPFDSTEKLDRQAFNARFAAMLSDETAALYGLGAEAVPDDVFQNIFNMLVGDAALVRVTTRFSDGRIAPGVPLAGVSTLSGMEPITGSNGKALVAIASGGSTVMVGHVIDLTGSTVVKASAGEIVDAVLTVSPVNYKAFASSAVVRISGACTQLDVTAVGGGGGGGGAGSRASIYGGGGGGGGGQVVVSEWVYFAPNTEIAVTAGAGGDGGVSASYKPTAGKAGGRSAFGDVSASGGGGGGTPDSGGAGGSGIKGGKGGDSTNTVNPGRGQDGEGGKPGYSSFTATTDYSGGGGGGSGMNFDNDGGGSGGWPGGGGGASVAGTPGNGRYYGGGGGGACGSIQKAGNGYGGFVSVRLWHGEENA